MKVNHEFVKTDICGTPYLLPYGQRIADHASPLLLNGTGSLLYDSLRENEDADRETLLSSLQKAYDIEEEDMAEVAKDVSGYLEHLTRAGVLNCEEEYPVLASPEPYYYQIGNLTFSLQAPSGFAEKYFSAFACPKETSDRQKKPDQRIVLFPGRPLKRHTGTIVVRSEELLICETSDTWFFLFLNDWPFYEMRMRKDGSEVTLYCHCDFQEKNEEAAFHALRFAFLLLAANHNLYVLHSASVLYKDRAWLFTGPSGTGKSTHTNLWTEAYGTPVLNGDLNLLGMENNTPMVYGLPWCGTSGIFTAKKYPLGGIILLKQAPVNHVLFPAADKKILAVMQRFISPSWSESQMLQNLNFAVELSEKVPICKLLCNPTLEAASTMKEAIDQFCAEDNIKKCEMGN